MNMTHYMQLLADNQPWNLILFMVIPVFLAETVAITELFVLLNRRQQGVLRTINRVASVAGGFYFLGVFAYLMTTAAIPLTLSGEWRGPADVLAVGFYLVGVVPLLGMALMDLGWLGRRWDFHTQLKVHASFVGAFLVVAHIAMVFGMLDPTLMGATSGVTGAAHGAH